MSLVLILEENIYFFVMKELLRLISGIKHFLIKIFYKCLWVLFILDILLLLSCIQTLRCTNECENKIAKY